MTPCQKIKRDILFMATEYLEDCSEPSEVSLRDSILSGVNEDTVDKQYNQLVELDLAQDYESEFREGEVETGLPSEYSRHYESKSVARKLSDGSWVGWIYWYGGGKHGNPGEIEWMEDAYNLEVTETEKLVLIREFRKI